MKNKTLVLGLGVSGRAAAEFLLKQGDQVLGIDSNRDLLKTSEELRQLHAKGLQFQHDSDPVNWTAIARVVVSPGVSPQHPIYQGAKERNIATGEAELALPYFDKPLVAVTGTNGKTTVTLLVEHILNAAGIKVKALGNVGTPLCAHLLQPSSDEAYVVELSSFQLETMTTPVFEAAALLNVTPDHLDRYANIEEYAKAKFHLQFLLKGNGPFFVQAGTAAAFSSMVSKDIQTFAVDGPADLYTDRHSVYYREKIEFLMPDDYRKMGVHDHENALAAWALCRPFSIDNEQFCKALATFKKPAHRIEFVREVDGIFYYDDSKGTNIDAVIQAVKAMNGPVILIAGGIDKGASYLLWKEHFVDKVKQIIAIGQAAPKIYKELNPYFNIKLADTLAAAVQTASHDAASGDFVLLSPGCSSYDMFRDYVHRGEEFQRQVQSIEERRKT